MERNVCRIVILPREKGQDHLQLIHGWDATVVFNTLGHLTPPVIISSLTLAWRLRSSATSSSDRTCVKASDAVKRRSVHRILTSRRRHGSSSGYSTRVYPTPWLNRVSNTEPMHKGLVVAIWRCLGKENLPLGIRQVRVRPGVHQPERAASGFAGAQVDGAPRQQKYGSLDGM